MGAHRRGLDVSRRGALRSRVLRFFVRPLLLRSAFANFPGQLTPFLQDCTICACIRGTTDVLRRGPIDPQPAATLEP